MIVKVYTSKNCPPCLEIDRLIKEGLFSGESEVEIIDIESEEGFAEFKKEVIDFEDGVVPSAYKEGAKCTIKISGDGAGSQLIFECPTTAPSSTD